MTKNLNETASKLSAKYIRVANPDNVVDTRKKRGLQSEINKMDAMRRILLTNNIEQKELLRFRTELNKMGSLVDSLLTP